MRQKNLLTALLVSAGAAYFFDKAKGAERRTMVKNKVGDLFNASRRTMGAGPSGSALDRTARDRTMTTPTAAGSGELDRTIDPTVSNVW